MTLLTLQLPEGARPFETLAQACEFVKGRVGSLVLSRKAHAEARVIVGWTLIAARPHVQAGMWAAFLTQVGINRKTASRCVNEALALAGPEHAQLVLIAQQHCMVAPQRTHTGEKADETNCLIGDVPRGTSSGVAGTIGMVLPPDGGFGEHDLDAEIDPDLDGQLDGEIDGELDEDLHEVEDDGLSDHAGDESDAVQGDAERVDRDALAPSAQAADQETLQRAAAVAPAAAKAVREAAAVSRQGTPAVGVQLELAAIYDAARSVRSILDDFDGVRNSLDDAGRARFDQLITELGGYRSARTGAKAVA